MKELDVESLVVLVKGQKTVYMLLERVWSDSKWENGYLETSPRQTRSYSC